MIAALLCPGPSLMKTFDPTADSCDVTIGVNRAVHAVYCDWWVFKDRETFDQWRPDYAIKMFVEECVRSRVWDGPNGPAFDAIERLEMQYVECHAKHNWSCYSATCGLVLATHLGADQVNVYGADWKGELDWDGVASARELGRTERRWAKEAELWGQTVEWCASKGTAVARILPEEVAVHGTA